MSTNEYLYIKSGDTIFFFDSVTTVDIQYSNTLTSNPIQDGRTATDHIFSNPTTVSFIGTISDFKVLGKENSPQAKSNSAWLDGVINQHRMSAWSLKYRADKEAVGGFFIKSVSPALKKIGGLDAKGVPITSYEISISFEEVLFAKSASFTSINTGIGKENSNTQSKVNKVGTSTEIKDMGNTAFANDKLISPTGEIIPNPNVVGKTPKRLGPVTKKEKLDEFLSSKEGLALRNRWPDI